MAKAIAAFCPKKLAIDCGGLTSLSLPVAEHLAKYRGRILLDGVGQLSPEVAEALARKEGVVSLAGLETVSPEVARSIAGSKHLLTEQFPRLSEISPAAVRALIDGIQRNERDLGGRFLDLSGLRSRSPECAREIADNHDVWIALGGLQDLSEESAGLLAGYRGQLKIACPGGRITPAIVKLMKLATERGAGKPAIFFCLVGVETLSPEDVATLAATSPVGLQIGGIRRLAPETVKAAVEHLAKPGVFFCDLVSVPAEFVEKSPAANGRGIKFRPEAAEQFVQTATTLTREVAESVVALAAAGHGSSLNGIKSIESRDATELAAILATSKARLAIPRLRRISPKTLSALIAKEDVHIPLIETLELIEEPDGSTEDFVIPETFLQPGPRR